MVAKPYRANALRKARTDNPAALTQSEETQVRLVRVLVAARFGIREADLEAPTRGAPEVALVRQISMYLAHIVFGISLSRIAKHFGRDRTTVGHACALVEDLRDDRVLDGELDFLESILNALASGRPIRGLQALSTQERPGVAPGQADTAASSPASSVVEADRDGDGPADVLAYPGAGESGR
jgi:hypothetical protein